MIILAMFWDFRLGAWGGLVSFSGVLSIVISGVGDFSHEISSDSFLEIKISSKIQKFVFNCLINPCTVYHFTQFCLKRKSKIYNNFEKYMYKEKSPNWILKTFTYKEIKIDIDTSPKKAAEEKIVQHT